MATGLSIAMICRLMRPKSAATIRSAVSTTMQIWVITGTHGWHDGTAGGAGQLHFAFKSEDLSTANITSRLVHINQYSHSAHTWTSWKGKLDHPQTNCIVLAWCFSYLWLCRERSAAVPMGIQTTVRDWIRAKTNAPAAAWPGLAAFGGAHTALL
jgi:hypothetical protein